MMSKIVSLYQIIWWYMIWLGILIQIYWHNRTTWVCRYQIHCNHCDVRDLFSFLFSWKVLKRKASGSIRPSGDALAKQRTRSLLPGWDWEVLVTLVRGFFDFSLALVAMSLKNLLKEKLKETDGSCSDCCDAPGINSNTFAASIASCCRAKWIPNDGRRAGHWQIIIWVSLKADSPPNISFKRTFLDVCTAASCNHNTTAIAQNRTLV